MRILHFLLFQMPLFTLSQNAWLWSLCMLSGWSKQQQTLPKLSQYSQNIVWHNLLKTEIGITFIPASVPILPFTSMLWSCFVTFGVFWYHVNNGESLLPLALLDVVHCCYCGLQFHCWTGCGRRLWGLPILHCLVLCRVYHLEQTSWQQIYCVPTYVN